MPEPRVRRSVITVAFLGAAGALSCGRILYTGVDGEAADARGSRPDAPSIVDAEVEAQGGDADRLDGDATVDAPEDVLDSSQDECPGASFLEGGLSSKDAGPPWSGTHPTLFSPESAQLIVLDASYVYWTDEGGGAYACARLGCATPTVLSSDASSSGVYQTLTGASSTAYFLALNPTFGNILAASASGAPVSEYSDAFYTNIISDSNSVYFSGFVSSGAGQIYACAFGATCSAPMGLLAGLHAGDPALGPIATSATEVFYAEGATPSISAVAIGGGSRRIVCESCLLGSDPLDSNVSALVVAGEYVYFTILGGSELYECAVAGGGSPRVYDPGPAISVSADGTDLYWTTTLGGGSVVTCPVGATCKGSMSVASEQGYVNAVQARDNTVYWAASTGIYSASK